MSHKSSSLKKLSVAYIEWEDSCSTSGWVKHDVKEHRPIMIRSVGILAYDKKFVTLSTSEDEFGKHSDPMSIPRSAIKKVRKYKF